MKLKPWFALPEPQQCARVVIIGGGLAGLASAYALVRAGIDVCMLEAEATLASGASGNPAGLLMPQLSAGASIETVFHRRGVTFTRQVLKELDAQRFSVQGQLNGLLYLADQPRLAKRFETLASQADRVCKPVSATEASELAGSDITVSGLYLAEAGWISIPSLCEALFAACQNKLQIFTNTRVIELSRRDTHWQLRTAARETFSAGAVIVANAGAARELKLLADVPIQIVPGQLNRIDCGAAAQTNLPLCGAAYCLPMAEDQAVLGASFRAAGDTAIKRDDYQHNLAQLARFAPALAKAWQSCRWQGRVALRATSPDHLPIVGPFIDQATFKSDYARLQHGDQRYPYPQAAYLPGLYMNLAHGARGLSSCLLAGKLLADSISGAALTLDAKLYQAVHPSRFWLKQLRKGTH